MWFFLVASAVRSTLGVVMMRSKALLEPLISCDCEWLVEVYQMIDVNRLDS